MLTKLGKRYKIEMDTKISTIVKILKFILYYSNNIFSLNILFITEFEYKLKSNRIRRKNAYRECW